MFLCGGTWYLWCSYDNRPWNSSALRADIHATCAAITPSTLECAVARMREQPGEHSMNLLFHMRLCGCVNLQHFATATLQCCLCKSTWKEYNRFVHSSSFMLYLGPCRSSGGYLPASNRGGPGSSPGQVMWDLWWTKCDWGRFPPSTSISLSILISPVAPH
jgi:hypothetical protein